MKYFVKKILMMLLTLVVISLLTFAAFHIIPGDPAQLILGTNASEEKLEALRAQLGTNLPLWQQYVNWMKGFLHGDPGTSIRYSMPVKELMQGHLSVTVVLGVMAIAAALAAGLPLGVFMAGRKHPASQTAVTLADILGLSFPGFFLSVLLMWIFGLTLHLFTPGAYVSYEKDPAGFFRYMIFPALAVAIPQAAILARYVQTAVQEELKQDYVRTARGKGARPGRIVCIHVLRNAVVSILPLLGMMVANVFSGSIIVEQVFSVPGMGKLLISSVTGRDFPLTQALVMYIAVVIVAVNFVVDLLVQAVDPRIRLAGSGRIGTAADK